MVVRSALFRLCWYLRPDQSTRKIRKICRYCKRWNGRKIFGLVTIWFVYWRTQRSFNERVNFRRIKTMMGDVRYVNCSCTIKTSMKMSTESQISKMDTQTCMYKSFRRIYITEMIMTIKKWEKKKTVPNYKEILNQELDWLLLFHNRTRKGPHYSRDSEWHRVNKPQKVCE